MVTFVCDHGKCPQLVIYARCKWYNMQLDGGLSINESVLKAQTFPCFKVSISQQRSTCSLIQTDDRSAPTTLIQAGAHRHRKKKKKKNLRCNRSVSYSKHYTAPNQNKASVSSAAPVSRF